MVRRSKKLLKRMQQKTERLKQSGRVHVRAKAGDSAHARAAAGFRASSTASVAANRMAMDVLGMDTALEMESLLPETVRTSLVRQVV